MPSRAGASSGSFVGGEQRLNFIISATNMATPGIMAVQAGFANLTAVGMRTMDHLNEAMGATQAAMMALGLVSTLALGTAVKAAADFEGSMQMVKAVSNGTTEEFNQMSTGAKKMAAEYGMSANEIASNLQVLGRAGLDASSHMSVFESSMKMAKLEGMDLETSIEGLIKMVGLFGTSVNSADFGEKAAEMATDLTHASQISPTNVQDIMQGMQFIGGAAKTANMDQKDTLAALSYMATLGVSGSMAGTALRGFVTKPTLQQPEVIQAMRSINIAPESLWEEGGDVAKPIWEQVKIINDSMEDLGLSQMEKIGIWSKIGMQKTAQQMLKIDEGEMKAYYDKMQEDFNIDEKVKIAMDSLVEQFNRFKSSLEVLLINVGEFWLPLIRLFVDALNSLAKILADNKIVADALALALGAGVFAGIWSLLTWAKEIVVFLKEARNLSTVIAALEGTSTAATHGAIANTQALRSAELSMAQRGAHRGIDPMVTMSSMYGFPMRGYAPKPPLVASQFSRINPMTGAILRKPVVDYRGISYIANKEGQIYAETFAKEATQTVKQAQKAPVMDPWLFSQPAYTQTKVAATAASAETSAAAANTGFLATQFGKLKGAASSAWAKVAGGAKAFWGLLLGIGPAGWAVIAILAAIAAAAYIIYKQVEQHNKELQKFKDNYAKSKKEAADYFDTTYKKATELKDFDPLEIRLNLETKEFDKKLQKASDDMDALVAKDANRPWRGNIWDPVSPFNLEKPSQGPYAYSQHNDWTMDDEKYKGIVKLNYIWEPTTEFLKFKQFLESDEKLSRGMREQYTKIGEKKFMSQAGIAPVNEATGRTQKDVTSEINEYTRAVELNWINLKKGQIYQRESARLWDTIWLVIKRFLTAFGLYNKSAEEEIEQKRDGKKSSDSSASAIKNMNDAQWEAMKASLWLEYSLYRLSNAIMWVSNVTAAFLEYVQSVDLQSEAKAAGYSGVGGIPFVGEGLQWGLEKFGFSANTEATERLNTNIKEANTKYGGLSSAEWFAPLGYSDYASQRLMEVGPSWPGQGGTYLSSGDVAGTGEAGELADSGAGTGGGKGFKSKAGSGYTIDFVLCSQKTLPPLDPNLFKKSKMIDLTQKTFKIDNLNINTRDKPENINAAVRKTIVDISEANRVNPREVVTKEV